MKAKKANVNWSWELENTSNGQIKQSDITARSQDHNAGRPGWLKASFRRKCFENDAGRSNVEVPDT
jgi:hypothetical protein